MFGPLPITAFVSHHDHSDKGLDLVTPINHFTEVINFSPYQFQVQFSNHKNCPYIIYLKMTCNWCPFQEMRDPKNEVASQTKEWRLFCCKFFHLRMGNIAMSTYPHSLAHNGFYNISWPCFSVSRLADSPTDPHCTYNYD